MSIRDSQRSKVYKSDNTFESLLGSECRIESIPNIQTYVDKITNSNWWKKRTHITWITVLDGRSRSTPCAGISYKYNGHYIKLPKFARHQGMILHEIAHVLNSKNRNIEPIHGRSFCRLLLDLVGKWISKEYQSYLRMIYKDNRVKYCSTRGIK